MSEPVAKKPSAVNNIEARRRFLATSAGAIAATAAIGNVHAAGSDVIKVGLVGCGGRGTGAAGDALRADKGVRLVALADVFQDRLNSSKETLTKSFAEQMDVPAERCFTGFDAYQKLIQSDVNVVLLAAPPHFRPLHLRAAVEAGKHVFAEKPVAVDGPGCRSVFETVALAKQKGLSIVNGLCYRYHDGMRELMQRLHDGAIGDIRTIQVNYNMGYLWEKPRQPEWTDMEWQLRNWLYFTWLSGDQIVEQHVHTLDKAAWAMGDQYPIKAVGFGGRQQRTEAKYGNVWDNMAVTFEFANGARCFSYCRQQADTATDVSDVYVGTNGSATSVGAATQKITGPKEWKFRVGRNQKVNMYQKEHDELFAAIRSNSPINNGDYMTKSTLMGVMGRMAAYTGREVTWEQALESKDDLSPPKYEFGSLAVAPIAVPGVTKLV